MDAILISVVSVLLTIVISLLLYIWRSMVSEIKGTRAMFHNYNTIMFRLLSRLHPGSAPVIAEAMQELYEGRRPNGQAKGVYGGQ